jgi:fumarate hydratase class II
MTMAYRIEKDSMGPVQVPADALYGAQTMRAVENFPVSGIPFPRSFIRALGLIKLAAAQVNQQLGHLEPALAASIVQAAQEVTDGRWDADFPIDIFQTGSGTSTNMNANEVIANRALQILGQELGSKMVHPNDHVNMGQSSNDVIPTAVHVAAYLEVHEALAPALRHLQAALVAKAIEFDDVLKTGRTHLMDAMPVRLGQEFGGYAAQIEASIAPRREPACRGWLSWPWAARPWAPASTRCPALPRAWPAAPCADRPALPRGRTISRPRPAWTRPSN